MAYFEVTATNYSTSRAARKADLKFLSWFRDNNPMKEQIIDYDAECIDMHAKDDSLDMIVQFFKEDEGVRRIQVNGTSSRVTLLINSLLNIYQTRKGWSLSVDLKFPRKA